jgi:hypothetical protein
MTRTLPSSVGGRNVSVLEEQRNHLLLKSIWSRVSYHFLMVLTIHLLQDL